MSNPSTYTTISGTAPDADEQHEARTIQRDRQEGLYMMTEIADGTFVQWSECAGCHKRVGECTHADGPLEPDYISRWRIGRFTDSFKGRGVEPPLPVALEQRDRVLNASIRELAGRGFTITPPASDEIQVNPDSEVVDEFTTREERASSLEEGWSYREDYDDDWTEITDIDYVGDTVLINGETTLDIDTVVEVPNVTWRKPTVAEAQRGSQNETDIETESDLDGQVAEKVDAGMDTALATLRARAQEDPTDAGF